MDHLSSEDLSWRAIVFLDAGASLQQILSLTSFLGKETATSSTNFQQGAASQGLPDLAKNECEGPREERWKNQGSGRYRDA